MTHFFNENAPAIILLTAFFICEILAHTTKIKANSLFQLIFGWIKKEKEKLSPSHENTVPVKHTPNNRDELK